jgi:haloalkane dehalogenase
MSRTDFVRTPNARFADLPDYPFEPHYLTVPTTGADGFRMHYVDEGPGNAKPVLMLHGEPSWSYLYRSMIPVFVDAGMRAVAPDLIGFGKSDKPTARSIFSYQQHMDWITAWLEAVDLRGVTLICQDWGSLLGLRLAAENPDRFDRIVVANGFLPTGDRDPGAGFKIWRAFTAYSPLFPIGRIIDTGTKRSLSAAERAAYDAPYPSSRYKAAARAFPGLVPTSPKDPAAPANRLAWEALGQWEKPFLTLFGRHDPILGKADKTLHEHIPGTRGQPHQRLDGSHFIQEDCGPVIARRTIDWING